MWFILFWIVSSVIVFGSLYLIFNLDEKYAYGSTREFVEEIWVVFLIFSILPFFQLLVVVITFVAFVIIFILEKMDDNNFDGEDVLKKIFFIKDGKK